MPLNPATIGVVVVTYFPEDAFFDSFLGIVSRVGHGIIVDNGSTEAQRQHLRAWAEKDSIELLLNDKNEGLARGLNQGIEKAREIGLTWAFLLDQDSQVENDFVESYSQAIELADTPERIAVVGSNYSNIVGNDTVNLLPADKYSGHAHRAKAVITAGSLISLPIFFEAGRFRDDFFIDWVDTEYCYRVRKLGFDVYRLSQPVIRQKIGQTIKIDSPFGIAYSSNHSPLRRYYMMRNLILLFRDYAAFEPGWFLGRFWDALKTSAKILFFEDQKTEKLLQMIRGIAHGFR